MLQSFEKLEIIKIFGQCLMQCEYNEGKIKGHFRNAKYPFAAQKQLLCNSLKCINVDENLMNVVSLWLSVSFSVIH